MCSTNQEPARLVTAWALQAEAMCTAANLRMQGRLIGNGNVSECKANSSTANRGATLMKRYAITETVACWVSWTCEIMAESTEEARRQYDLDPARDWSEPSIGDSIDEYEIQVEVDEVTQ